MKRFIKTGGCAALFLLTALLAARAAAQNGFNDGRAWMLPGFGAWQTAEITPAVEMEEMRDWLDEDDLEPFNPDNFILIPGGTYMMGSPPSEIGRDVNEVRHQVTLSAFYMNKFEVTQEEYLDVMGVNPSRFKGVNLPVDSVTWFDAINYCNALSRKEGKTPVYIVNGADVRWNTTANGYRLPTEAEWEYACRAGSIRAFSNGNNIDTKNANYNGKMAYLGSGTGIYRAATTPVGTFPPNAWGLFDMHGNVYEWCWDWYAPYGILPQVNPAGTDPSSQVRVTRGGSWRSSAANLRSAYRASNVPTSKDAYQGFRLVRQR